MILERQSDGDVIFKPYRISKNRCGLYVCSPVIYFRRLIDERVD
jgi:hypothetical protein